ncbi:MAG: DUF3817 domain-containing protein [Nocardioides sp.]
MSPQALFRRVAIAEAVTWALLLVGMFLKYVTDTTELGVRIFGMVHGVVFIAYCLAVVVVSIDQRWSITRSVLGLAAALPPFATILFDLVMERRAAFADWRLTASGPERTIDRPVAWLLRNPARGAVAAGAAVVVLTGVALLVGPPTS